MAFTPQRLSKTYEMRVPASPNEVFSLLCPIREYEWIEYWRCDLLFSETGVAEKDCVFRTNFPDRGEMIWVVTDYAPPRTIQYTVFRPNSHVLSLRINLSPSGTDSTVLTWIHTFTAISDQGNEYLSHYTDEHHQAHMGRIEDALVHFLATGELLQTKK